MDLVHFLNPSLYQNRSSGCGGLKASQRNIPTQFRFYHIKLGLHNYILGTLWLKEALKFLLNHSKQTFSNYSATYYMLCSVGLKGIFKRKMQMRRYQQERKGLKVLFDPTMRLTLLIRYPYANCCFCSCSYIIFSSFWR